MTPEHVFYAAIVGAAWCALVGIFVGYRIGTLNERERMRAAYSHNKALPADHPFNAPSRPVTIKTTYGDIPAEIVAAAYSVETWFRENNVNVWALGGVQSRTDVRPIVLPTDADIAEAVSIGDRLAAAARANLTCHARQQSSSMVCEPCGMEWDMNDSAPPACKPTVWVVNELPGKRPDDVEPGTVVTVRLPCGMTLTGPVEAFDWQRVGWEGDIVAWRRGSAGLTV